MALFARFLGRTASEGAAFALGTAVGPVLSPAVEELRNEAWRTHPSRTLREGDAAEIVAEDVKLRDWGAAEAAAHGIDGTRFNALLGAALNAPGIGELFAAFRRGLIDEAAFKNGLRKARLEERWDGPLIALRDVLLTPAELANARQQGFVDDARQLAESERQGVNGERAQILYELAGLPPGAMDGLTLLRRGIIDEDTYRRIVREGHTKTKYTDALLALREHILTATDAANLWLKGWIGEAEAKRIGAQNGYDAEAMDLLYKNRGRPATVRQAHIGYQRGGRLPGAGNDEKATIRRAVEESNIRSEWFDILYAQRYTYPSAFVLRALASDGTFSPAMTEQILTESGWKPEWAKLAAEKWGEGAGGGTAQKWADRARTRLFTVTHNEYQDQSIDAAKARENLSAIGVGAAEQEAILDLWDAEAGINRLELTPAQIRKAYKKVLYTREEALAELQERGMTPEDAETFLDSG